MQGLQLLLVAGFDGAGMRCVLYVVESRNSNVVAKNDHDVVRLSTLVHTYSKLHGGRYFKRSTVQGYQVGARSVHLRARDYKSRL